MHYHVTRQRPEQPEIIVQTRASATTCRAVLKKVVQGDLRDGDRLKIVQPEHVTFVRHDGVQYDYFLRRCVLDDANTPACDAGRALPIA